MGKCVSADRCDPICEMCGQVDCKCREAIGQHRLQHVRKFCGTILTDFHKHGLFCAGQHRNRCCRTVVFVSEDSTVGKMGDRTQGQGIGSDGLGRNPGVQEVYYHTNLLIRHRYRTALIPILFRRRIVYIQTDGAYTENIRKLRLPSSAIAPMR